MYVWNIHYLKYIIIRYDMRHLYLLSYLQNQLIFNRSSYDSFKF